jgi:hypothetical protein
MKTLKNINLKQRKNKIKIIFFKSAFEMQKLTGIKNFYKIRLKKYVKTVS